MESLIGASPPRPDAQAKAAGALAFPGDLVRPDMLHLCVVFAHRPHARIVHIDSQAALAHPGVVAVLTAADVPFNAVGLIDADQPVLCGDVVRYVGDKVALVVAETPAAARAAAALVQVDYVELPALTDPHAALEPDAPLVHPDRLSNLLTHVPIRKGDAAAALAAADVVIEETFSTSWQEHAFLQPEAGIAFVDDDERVVVETAGQWLHEDRRQIAAMLALPPEQVVVRYAAIGGAFGGREDLSLQHLLALAAWKLRRPVAIVWTREESMLSHFKRHPMWLRCRWGAQRDGTLVAVEADVLADGGAYASTSAEVIKVTALFASGCYEVPNIQIDARVVFTNNIPTGAFRGFGAPQAQFASELMIARVAEALGLDAQDVRRRNIYREGSLEPTHHPLPPVVSALPVLERCIAEAHDRLGQQPPAAPHLRRGVGIAAGIKNLGYSFGFPEQSTATVTLTGGAQIERAEVRAGIADVGQGTHIAMRQVAAATLGVPLDVITLISDDSSEAPNAGSASASRLTVMAGRAIHDAAQAALVQWHAEERPAQATVQYRPPPTTTFDAQTTACRPHYAYGYAAQAVEIEVNTLTGQVRVLTVISVHDVGRVINPQQLTGQIEGGVVQAVGYALMERFQMRDGYVTTPHLSSYLVPTSMDTPEIVPVFLEEADLMGPFGARGVAELPLVPMAPAVALALHDALGIWLTHQPLTPDQVMAALVRQS